MESLWKKVGKNYFGFMLAIISTHPIQYQVPLYKALAKTNLEFEVWYLTRHGLDESLDIQFGEKFKWDIELLAGYKYTFLNVNKDAAPNRGFFNLKLRENLVKRINEKNVKILWINGWQVLAYWQAIFQVFNLKLIICFRGESNDLKPEIWWKYPLKKQLLGLFFKRIDYFLYIGQANKRLYERYGIDDTRLLPGYYSVDNYRFKYSSGRWREKFQEIKELWNIDIKSKVILFSGKFISKKRPMDLIRAVKKIQEDGYSSNIHLLFVGSGELYEEMKDSCFVHYDGLSKRTYCRENPTHLPSATFSGFLNQSEIAKAYAIADCLVLPSGYGETWGLVVNEALASGVPCIVSEQCGCAEDLIKPFYREQVFECGNVYQLSKAIRSLLDKNLILPQRFEEITAKYNYNTTINSISIIAR